MVEIREIVSGEGVGLLRRWPGLLTKFALKTSFFKHIRKPLIIGGSARTDVTGNVPGGGKVKRTYLLAAVACIVLLAMAGQAFAASSPTRGMIKLGGDNYLQVRGVDKPHSVSNFSSWPGYTTFVHSNCYHVHGEYKRINSSTGREYYSKSVSVPIYCKGLTKYISKAFKYGAEELGLSTWKFLKVGGWLVVLINEIPSVGGKMQVCNQNATTNSTYCYWQEY